MSHGAPDDGKGLICDTDNFAVHDGPGIRMALYLKGCPLACRWCHSPETQRTSPEVIFMRDRCVLCAACVEVCPHNLHRVEGPEHFFDRAGCTACGRCAERCSAGALAVKGRRVSAAALVARAVRLRPFFRHSDGGITLTGGEVTVQPHFAAAVLEGCRAEGIHTAVETCGACEWPRLQQVLVHTDLVLYDLKLMAPDAHRRWTGASNEQILRNAAKLATFEVQVRIPLISGITDTEENVRGIFGFMRSVGLRSAALMPYNESASAKYEWLGRTCAIQGETQGRDRLADLRKMAEGMGIETEVG